MFYIDLGIKAFFIWQFSVTVSNLITWKNRVQGGDDYFLLLLKSYFNLQHRASLAQTIASQSPLFEMKQ